MPLTRPAYASLIATFYRNRLAQGNKAELVEPYKLDARSCKPVATSGAVEVPQLAMWPGHSLGGRPASPRIPR
jgi:hypothetical protein